MNDQIMTVTAAATEHGPVLVVAGDLDLHTVPLVREALRELALGPGRRLFLDLRGLTFCDSSGIACLIEASNQAASAGSGIALVAVPAPVQRILRMVGLTQMLRMYDSVADANRAPSG
ncbi:MAG TPA: STAS domain-containing protein [Actinocrinis sp.]|nr:STAS domain-containing protein [Actinocrinis sp.]